MTVNHHGAAGAPDAEALDWAIRIGEPAFDDWDGFTRWLEADPARAERYDAAVAALAEVEREVARLPARQTGTASPRPAPAHTPQRWSAPRWVGGAMAAALVGAVGLGAWMQRAQPYVVETADGRTRTLPLADGSELVLAGGTRVRLDRADPRLAALDRGEVLFRVRHDPRAPFRVTAGAVELTDLGTVFDVAVRGRGARVAVAEGAVMIDPAGARVRLDPGQAARVEDGRIVRSAIDPAAVGGWREGWLSFDGVPLADVAADLSRHLGVRVGVAPAIAGQRFRGTLDLDAMRRDPALLGALLGVRVRAGERGWMLEPPR